MRTNEERTALIRQRTRELKRQQARKKARIIDLSCVAGSLVLIFLLAMWIPDPLTFSKRDVAHATMTASLIGSSAFSGYIVMGILSFLLGVCVTILLHRLHHHFRDRKEERDEF